MKNKSFFGIQAFIILALSLTAVQAADFRTITIPLDPGVNGYGGKDIAVNTVINRIYTANATSDSVSVVDGSTDALIRNIAVGEGPSSIDVNNMDNENHMNTYLIIDGPEYNMNEVNYVIAWEDRPNGDWDFNDTVIQLTNMAPVNPVPEPATLLLFGIGLLFMPCILKRGKINLEASLIKKILKKNLKIFSRF